MASIRGSEDGLKRFKQARNKKGWNQDADSLTTGIGINRSTVQRFEQGQAIYQESFIALCKAVGIENWEEIVDDKSIPKKTTGNSPETENNPEENLSRRGLYIPGARCRKVWGRDLLIEKVLGYLTDPQGAPIFCLSGVAGYGKTEATALVAQAALAKKFFADVLWVQARESELVDSSVTSGSDTLNWEQFLYQISYQLDCPPEKEKVQRVLKEKKLLIVLDNAETADIEDILSKLVKILGRSRSLLTSRLKNNLQYVQPIECSGLEEEWSRKLLLDEARYKNISALIQANDEQLYRVHELTCGAPLALHFVVGRVYDDQELEPVLSSLEQADKQVEVFYRFTLETAWQRINDAAKRVLRYMGQANASVTQEELFGASGLSDSDVRNAKTQLERWSLILRTQDINQRYDLHPWVRRSVRSGLVQKWQPSLEELEQRFKWKLDI